jgi:hypothetical protein
MQYTLKRSMLVVALAGGVLGISDRAHAQQWIGGDGFWTDDWRWSGGAAPAAPTDDALIGFLPGSENATVTFDAAPALLINDLGLRAATTLDLNHNSLSVRRAFLDGSSTLIVRAIPIGGGAWFDFTGSVDIDPDAHMMLVDADILLHQEMMGFQNRVRGTLSGSGNIALTTLGPGHGAGPAGLINNGVIRPDNNGGLLIDVSGGAQLDLDGDAAVGGFDGQGSLDLTTPFAQLEVDANGLTDDFDGNIGLAFGSYLEMNTGEWRIGETGGITVLGADNVAASQIGGDHMSVAGFIVATGASSQLRVLADATLEETTQMQLNQGALVEFDGATTVEGGTHVLNDNSRIYFDGETTMRGGDFQMPGVASTASVEFRGDTTWDGDVTFEHVARQIGDATVSGLTQIQARIFDMDGDGSTAWDINSAVSIQADAIDNDGGSNQFDGTIEIGAGIFPQLAVQLSDPGAAWRMAGTLDMTGSAFGVARLVGSDVIVPGQINVNSGDVRVNAGLQYTAPGGGGLFVADNASLTLTADTAFNASTSFTGSGTLRNEASMLLADTSELNAIDLINDGVLDIGIGFDQAGIVSMAGFEQTADGVLEVGIGGYLAGAEFDALLIGSDGADLNGLLSVSLLDLDLDGALFTPAVGDEFVIMESLDAIGGTFANNPVSFAHGLEYQWALDYDVDTVTLRLEAIVPAPGSIVLVGGAGLALLRRSRRC